MVVWKAKRGNKERGNYMETHRALLTKPTLLTYRQNSVSIRKYTHIKEEGLTEKPKELE